MARQRLEPATTEQIIRGLSSALILVAPAGFSEGDRKAWLTAAAITLEGIPPDLLERGVAAARRAADHPSRIVPSIMAEIGDAWQDRRRNLAEERRVIIDRQQPAEPAEPPCTPEEAARIMTELGLSSTAEETVKRHLGPPRVPTREDYIAMGVDPAVLSR